VSAALMRRYGQPGGPPLRRLRYWKPVQTGIEQDDDSEVVHGLAECRDDDILDDGVRLKRPVSPHLAARLAGRPVGVQGLLALAAAQPAADRWIVEGAGGVLVPLDESTLVVDLIGRLSLPVVVVARSSLGTINHTLLTLEALRSRDIGVAGVVMVGPVDRDNREAIESFGQVPVVGQLPFLDPLTPGSLAAWAAGGMDPEGRLEDYLQ
jgi:dethiobiotin synthetase